MKRGDIRRISPFFIYLPPVAEGKEIRSGKIVNSFGEIAICNPEEIYDLCIRQFNIHS